MGKQAGGGVEGKRRDDMTDREYKDAIIDLRIRQIEDKVRGITIAMIPKPVPARFQKLSLWIYKANHFLRLICLRKYRKTREVKGLSI